MSSARLLATIAIAAILSAVSLIDGQAPALAQRQSIRISPAQARQFSHDLIRSSSQDFFAQGRENFEAEIKILTEKRLFSQPPVLKIEQSSQFKGNLLPATNSSILLEQMNIGSLQ